MSFVAVLHDSIRHIIAVLCDGLLLFVNMLVRSSGVVSTVIKKIISILVPPGSKDPGGKLRLKTSWNGYVSASSSTGKVS